MFSGIQQKIKVQKYKKVLGFFFIKFISTKKIEDGFLSFDFYKYKFCFESAFFASCKIALLIYSSVWFGHLSNSFYCLSISTSFLIFILYSIHFLAYSLFLVQIFLLSIQSNKLTQFLNVIDSPCT